LTLCYNCRRPRHLSKEFLGIGPICLCCKDIGHEVEDCPRMIAKVEKMNMRQENYEEGQGSVREPERERIREILDYVSTIKRSNG
jgi:hypothetical protein